jgi:uncharacterized iron-regulated protein
MMRFAAPGALSTAFFLLAVVLLPASGLPQEPEQKGDSPRYYEHFRVFTGDGIPASLDDIVRAMESVDVVMVGEIHTDPVGHWIEAELFRRAVALTGAGEEAVPGRALALSLEMFERDVQGILDEYLLDLITEAHFKASARPWEHYDTDYRPMVEAAKAAGVPVIAANAPRRYVNRVSRMGPASLSALPASALAYLPPLPYPEPTQAYRDEWNALMANMTMESQCPVPEEEGEDEELVAMRHPPADSIHTPPEGMHHRPPARMRADSAAGQEKPHGPPTGMPTDSVHGGMRSDSASSGMPPMGRSFMENGLYSQTLWDASMAYAITTFLDDHPGALVLHMVGGFHVKNFTGIPEKVEFYRPGTRRMVVHMDLAEDFSAFHPKEHAGRGDFVILTDQALDLNYERNCADQGDGAR